ncbi:ECF-type sigma factor [Rhodopirellula sallentina]|uniref:RNA polymerase sigma-70 ECF-like protein n=1 Tax=Rhodopirellula sallentina SM41 TaxID=1263870 RepID=M5UBY8_9BACT|nr:ECF-type sigma factor [Rhodopirellula sallentina]EMI53518.1 RNA polymerase sigma-70 ECF-like protein [Rhodopirellula sallentina SM41]
MSEKEEDGITLLMAQLSDGGGSASDQLWQEYFPKLANYARRKLAPAAARSYDGEDVALSAMNSFYEGMKERKFDNLHGRDELWRLLLTITARKVSARHRKVGRLKRGAGKVRGESVFGNVDDGERAFGIGDLLGTDPTPELIAELSETTQQLLNTVDDERVREIVRLRLEGYRNSEIAEKLGCAKRTVERKIELLRETWNESAGSEFQV